MHTPPECLIASSIAIAGLSVPSLSQGFVAENSNHKWPENRVSEQSAVLFQMLDLVTVAKVTCEDALRQS